METKIILDWGLKMNRGIRKIISESDITLECQIKVLPYMQHVGWHCHKTCLFGTQNVTNL